MGARPRPGYSNAALAGLLALVAVIALLTQIQRGAIDFGALVASPAGGKSASARGGTAPQLFPPEPPAPDPATETDPGAPTAEQYQPDPQRELGQALARMDGRAAARLLAELEPESARGLLATLHERDLARILEEADPAMAARWIEELLALGRAVPDVPPPASGEDTTEMQPDTAGSEPAAEPPPAADESSPADTMEEGGAPPASSGSGRPPPDSNVA